jgi:hypothetical protein
MSNAPHIDAFNRKLGRPVDEEPFEAWFNLMHRYANRKIDSDVLEVYRRALRRIPVDRLKVMWEEFIENHENVRDIPSVKRLLDIYNSQKNNHQALHPKKPEEIMATDPLKAQLFPAVHRAITGDKPHGMNAPAPPEWIQTIADYAGQQHRGGLSIADAYALAIRMMEEERDD